jgi:hypothetical protein
MARLGGVCSNVFADLEDSCGVARRETAIEMVIAFALSLSKRKSKRLSSRSLVKSPAAGSRRPGLLRSEQACRNLTEDLLVVSGYRSFHMNTSALYACFLRQPLELTLKKDFHLLRCQEGNGNSSGLARLGLDFYAVWGFVLLRF